MHSVATQDPRLDDDCQFECPEPGHPAEYLLEGLTLDDDYWPSQWLVCEEHLMNMLRIHLPREQHRVISVQRLMLAPVDA